MNEYEKKSKIIMAILFGITLIGFASMAFSRGLHIVWCIMILLHYAFAAHFLIYFK